MIVNGSDTLSRMAAVPLPTRERGVCCAPVRRMREDEVVAFSDVMKALADPTRLEIVAILRDAKDPVCICDLEAAFDLSQPTLSHHMARLRDAGLIESERNGIWTFYRLRRDLPAPTRRVVNAIA